jgi:hypothetical protein
MNSGRKTFKLKIDAGTKDAESELMIKNLIDSYSQIIEIDEELFPDDMDEFYHPNDDKDIWHEIYDDNE